MHVLPALFPGGGNYAAAGGLGSPVTVQPALDRAIQSNAPWPSRTDTSIRVSIIAADRLRQHSAGEGASVADDGASCWAAPERPLAGIIGYSGRLVAPHLLAEEFRSRSPGLLVHGANDSRVTVEPMTEAETALRAAGVPVETLACIGTEHSIDRAGLVRGGLFLRQTLSAPVH